MLFAVAQADELLWPLPFGKTLTGGFADSRPDHFHGGVDLRTGPEPRDVIAPTNGYVERIAVAPNGYGRVLYFRLSDGRTAVFGHLSRFAPAIEKIARSAQLLSETYRIDFATDSTDKSLYFSRGETIAYTGQTGMGPPHLHFEIREGAVQTDPLANYNPRDTQRPVITAVRWTNRDEFDATANGVTVLAHAAPARIRSDSPVAFYVQCYDPGPWGRNAVPREIRVSQDGNTVYTARCGRINLLSDADIYEQLVWADRINDKDMRRLFIPPSANSGEVLPAGWITAEQESKIVITVIDRAGNQASREVMVTAHSARPRPSPTNSYSAGDFFLAAANDPLASYCSVSLLTSNQVSLAPELLGFGNRIRLAYDLHGQGVEHKFFYQLRSNGALRPLWRIPEDDTSASMACYIMKAGIYGVATDYNPPQLSLSVRQNRIRFRLVDDESAIDDSSVRCKVDEQTAIAEYEYEEDGGFIWTQVPLLSGSHAIDFSAADRAGNSQTWQETVTIP